MSVRRRHDPPTGLGAFEGKLVEAFSLSSRFTASEVALVRLPGHRRPGGVLGLWSNDPPDPAFTARLPTVFDKARAEPFTFDKLLQDFRQVTGIDHLAIVLTA